MLNTPSNPLVIRSGSLPFSETFLRYPSIYFWPKAGANAEVLYRNQSVGDVPPGSSFVGLRCKRDLQAFDTNSYFSPANADNMASLTLCELDLTGVAATEPLVLHISGMLVSADDSDLSTARMRVLLDGAPLADLQGALEQQATGKNQEWYFGLNGGEKHQLAIEFAGKGEDDLLAICRIAIRRAVQQPSVALRIVKAPANRPNMGMGTFTLELENKSVQPLANLLVKGYCCGKWVAQHTVEKLEGMGKAEFKMALDLSTSENLGELIATAFDCVVDPNNPTVNGHVAHEVNSQGKVVAMPTSRTVSSGLGPQIVDPKLRYTVREKLIFTDNGGYYGKHTDDQSATLKFLPSDPNMKVRVKFLRFALEPDEAALQVFTAFVPNDLTVSYTRDRAYLMGDKLEMPMTFISEAPDGGVTLFFEALEGSSADGWVAEVDMVPPANPLSLRKMSMHGRGTGVEGPVPITLTVRNSWSTQQPNATAMVRTAKGFYYREPVSIGLGETTITLNGKIDLPAATPTLMEVSIAGDDTNEIDNVLYGYAVYDRYCAPDSMPRRPVQMRAIMVNAHDNYLLKPKADGSVRYTLDNPAVLYRGDGPASLEVSTNGTTPRDFSLAAWVDWDDNGELTDAERVIVPLVGGNGRSATVTLDPSNATFGAKRMRLMVGKTDELTSACATLTLGDVQDCLLEVKEGSYPGKDDLAITRVKIGYNGQPRSNQEVAITIANLSNSPFTGKVKVKMELDGNAIPVDDLDFATTPISPYSGSRTSTLSAKVDLDMRGKHTVRVTIEEVPEVVNADNNANEASVWIVIPRNDGPYALAMQSLDSSESIAVSSVAEKLAVLTRGRKSWTAEMVFRLDRPQFADLMRAKGLQVATTYRMQNGVPSNAIGLLVGKNMIAYTDGNVITPGKWHHLSLVFKDIKFDPLDETVSSSVPLVYIDGVNCPLHANGSDVPDFGVQYARDLFLMPRAEARIKLFRAWSKELTPGEIEANLFSYCRNAGALPSDCFVEFAFDEGAGNAQSLSGTEVADISSKNDSRISAVTGGMWEKLRQLVDGFNFEGQTRATKLAEGKYEIAFPSGTNPAAIRGTIQKTWPSVALTYNGNPVDANTLFDFSREVKVLATADLFGKSGFSQELVFSYKEGKAAECELLSLTLEKTKNQGLAEDIALPSISQTNALGIPAASAQLNTKQVVLTYTLSEGARLLHAGVELTSGATPIDLSQPVLLQVEAADGQKKNYSLQLELAQTIEWSLAPQQTLVYGDAPVPVQASATSKLPLTFVSFQSRVATVAGGTLRIGKPGKATITALQPGGGVYAPASPVAHEVTVGKRPITVKATVAQATYGMPLDWNFTYTQLVDDEDLRSMPDPLGKGVFKILNSNGVEMQSSALLPVGHYTIAPQVDNAYETELYTVTPEGAEFDVVQGAYWPVSFRVQGADGQPLENATVMLGQQARTTDSQGEALYAVQEGASYSFTVRRDGYTPVVEYVNMVSGMAMQRLVTLRKATIALHYTAGEHGKLAGNANQLVAARASGQEVMAIPEVGYRFTGWSDGGTENPRIDRNVTQPFAVEAQFAKLTYTIAYSIGEGGMLESGESTRQQTVGYGNDGQEVKEADADHYFMSWDDGVASPARQEKDVKQDQAVTALFGRYMPLEPAQFNGFDNGAIGESWYTLAGGESGVAWEIASTPQGGRYLDGAFAIADGRRGGIKETKAYLYSPRYRLTVVTGGVIVAFDYIFSKNHDTGAEGIFALEYSVDEGATWSRLGDEVEETLLRKAWKNQIANADLVGKAYLQFRWSYTDTRGVYALLDNIVIAAEVTTQFTVHYQSNLAGACTFKEFGGGGATGATLDLPEAQGATPPRVMVQAVNPGFRFLEWTGGVKNVIYKSAKQVYQNETVTAYFRQLGKVTVHFAAYPEAGGRIVDADGNAVTEPEVIDSTGSTRQVTAVANEGYKFLHWSDGATEPTHSMANVCEDATLAARFEKLESYRVRFVVTDGRFPLGGATVRVAGQNLTTDANGLAESQPIAEGEYPYTVDCQGYVQATGNATANALQTTHSAVMRVVLLLTVTNSANEPIGQVELQLPNDTYPYRITSPGYNPEMGELAVSTATSKTIVLQRTTHTVTFTVKDTQPQPLPNATIEINGQSLPTNTKGNATISLPDGTYPYTARLKGYRTARGTVQVQGEDLGIEVTLTKEVVDAVESRLLANVDVYPNPCDAELRLRNVAALRSLAVVNALGQTVLTRTHDGAETVVVPTGTLPAGLYLLRLTDTEGGIHTLRFAKQ